MKANEVPQDNANVLEGKLKVIKYATDEKGDYTTVKTVGWEAENIVLIEAWAAINEKTESIKEEVKSGKLSPIAYYMEKQMLSVKMLSQYMNQWTFITKKHLKPKYFSKLSQQKLLKYAETFQITVEELKNIN